MNKILLALLAISVVLSSQAEAGEKKRRLHGSGYSQGYKHNYNRRGNGSHNRYNRSFNNNNNNHHNTYKYNYGGDNNGWYAFGGFLGGLAVGEAIDGGAYYYNQPGAQCTTIFERRWNVVYQEWENIPQTVCGGY